MEENNKKPQGAWGFLIAVATTILYAEAMRNPNKDRGAIFVAMLIIVCVLYQIGSWFGSIKKWRDQKVEGHYLAWLVVWVILLLVDALR